MTSAIRDECPPAAGPPAVRAVGVSKAFAGVPVLRDIDLTVEVGEVIAIIGPSGSGKSTLCRTLIGLELLDAGRIELFGAPWLERRLGMPLLANRSYAAMRQSMGMVFQHYTLFPQMTALQNVALGPQRVLGLDRAQARAAAEMALRRVGMWEKRGAYPAHLSGGQQQRAAIARELAMRRKILMLDEATSALDPELVQEVLEVVKELAAEGLTMLLVTHELRFASRIASRVVFMDEGQIVEAAPAGEFFDHPKQERTRRFLERIAY
jgi:ABC-type polar amino acid transport system ATPase subunit